MNCSKIEPNCVLNQSIKTLKNSLIGGSMYFVLDVLRINAFDNVFDLKCF